MISVFQVFKIILGVIIAAFILFFLLRFAGSYIDIGESSRQVSIAVSMKKSIEDVYTAGVPVDFEMKDSRILGYSPPSIITQVSNVDIDPVPLLLIPGDKFSIYRNEYNTGWWKFYFIEVFPETKILFIPLGEGDVVWSIMGNITKYLPSTENTKTKVNFYVGCNETDPVWIYPLGERNRFLNMIPKFLTFGVKMGQCVNTEKLKTEGYRIITISQEFVDADFLVQPINSEMGYVYIKNGAEQEEYIYKNALDILALFMGGKEYYNYLNNKFLRELEVGIDVAVKESNLLREDLTLRERCGSEFSKFTGTLGFIKDELIPKLYSWGEEEINLFNTYMRESVNNYRALERLGCG